MFVFVLGLLVAAARFIINRDELFNNLVSTNYENSFSNSNICFSQKSTLINSFMPVDLVDLSCDHQEPLSKFKYKVLI